MASLEENYEYWNHSYDWSCYHGDGWSARWGGPTAQWRWCVYPRVRQHLPAGVILEVGPGYGRWTQFLLDHCQELIIVDIAERCIHACKQRFEDSHQIRFCVGNGYSLDFLEDSSVDFIFSFESLVHTEIEILGSYLKEFSRVLRPGGSGFVHHSNLGSYENYFSRLDALPISLSRLLRLRGLADYDEWRAPTVTAENFERAGRDAGLHLVSQELVPWGGRRLIDCFSIFAKEAPARGFQRLENPHFIQQADQIRELQALYRSTQPS